MPSKHARLVLFLLPPLGCCTIGCDSRPKPTAVVDESPQTAPAPASKPSAPKIDVAALKLDDTTPATPGFATGRIVGADGKALALEGLRCQVILNGLLNDPVDQVTIPIDVGSDGSYAVPLEPGTYRQPTARAEFSFQDRSYRLPLAPLHGPTGRQESSGGVVQDFAFRLSGLRPGARNSSQDAASWIGGSIYPHLQGYRPDLGRVLASPPVGTKVVFTLEPQGPLADGTTAKPIVVERQYNAAQTSLNDPLISDLPLAVWRVTGEEHFPNGRKQPVLFLQQDEKWAPEVVGTFEPNLEGAALEQVNIRFTRQER